MSCQSIQRLRKGGTTWELVADFSSLLHTVLNTPGSVIKESPSKLVTVHHIGDQTFYVKHYRSHHLGRALKYFFKQSQARNEWSLSRHMEALGIPVVRHLAVGERWNWYGLQESLLITLGFAGIPLDQVSDADLPAVKDFVERMHARGVLQKDLHPGNLLMHPSTGELRLVDLKGTVVKGRLAEQECRENLAFLRIFLPIPVSGDVARKSRQLRSRIYSSRADRSLKQNREFALLREHALTWQLRLPYASAALKPILQDPEEVLRDRAEILKAGRSATLGAYQGYVLKRFRPRKRSGWIKDIFRPSRARRAFRKAYHLELLGISSPRPIATADKRRFRVLLRSYLVMERIPGALEMGQYLLQCGRPDLAVVRGAAALVARLHREGFSHRDLKERNILLDARLRPYIIDLDALVYRGRMTELRAAADLRRLARAAAQFGNVGRHERLVFLKHYCRERGITRVPRLSLKSMHWKSMHRLKNSG